AILLIYTRKNVLRRSALFLYMLLYGIERFILEYFRYDEIRGIFLGLSTSQWISIAMVVGGVIGFILLYRYEKKHPEMYERPEPSEAETNADSSETAAEPAAAEDNDVPEEKPEQEAESSENE
ncbi:MAG: prolipoprotein diacylglyceryl transferase, partial [Clostridia bacterium]|nr:prolipoprotein diacylglyceryl transferase [Clostridia bacterium]